MVRADRVGRGSIRQDLVLIGGGHSHVEVLRSFAMRPPPGVQLTLIARDVHTPYSGMLPGYIAGHYRFDDIHIDLRPLCIAAGARLYHDSAVAVDTAGRAVICAARPPVRYDLLSINTGSRPDLSVPGAAEFATPVKPIDRLVERWRNVLTRVSERRGRLRIGVVGAGAAGVELVLAVRHRLAGLHAAVRPEYVLVDAEPRLLSGFSAGVGRRFRRLLAERGVRVYQGVAVAEVRRGELVLADARRLELDEILWATGASAPAWPGESGLAVDGRGFIRVDVGLRSRSHGDIFAAGDIAAMDGQPRPKAGVVAVRQGPPLAVNLRRALCGLPLQPLRLQRSMLALISTGDRYAVASKGRWHAEGRLLWRWKDHIDRRWMRRYRQLPAMPVASSALDAFVSNAGAGAAQTSMRCGGCGAKVGPDPLRRALAGLCTPQRADVLIGLREADDAAVVEVPPGRLLVHTVDHFRVFIDDPYRFGQIAAQHGLNDLYAMGAEPQTALAIATVPYAAEAQVEDSLRQMLEGAAEVLGEAGAALVGGHSGEGAELALGFALNGLIARERLLGKAGLRPGDTLILSKPLGTGTLFAADMRGRAKGRWIASALSSMRQSNRAAAECFRRHQASACTDVSGFGLLGHLHEMLNASAVAAELELDALPLLDGALETVRAGLLSSLQPANLRLRRVLDGSPQSLASPRCALLFDPQTAGGLLAGVPKTRAEDCLRTLRGEGYRHAAAIGSVTTATGSPVRLH